MQVCGHTFTLWRKTASETEEYLGIFMSRSTSSLPAGLSGLLYLGLLSGLLWVTTIGTSRPISRQETGSQAYNHWQYYPSWDVDGSSGTPDSTAQYLQFISVLEPREGSGPCHVLGYNRYKLSIMKPSLLGTNRLLQRKRSSERSCVGCLISISEWIDVRRYVNKLNMSKIR